MATLYLFPVVLIAQVQISPEKPQRGDTVTVFYKPDGMGIPKNASQITLVFPYSNFYSLPYNIEMERVAGGWQTSFQLPRYAIAAAFYLSSGKNVNRPDSLNFYNIQVYDEDKLVLSADMYKAYSLSAAMGKSSQLPEKQKELYEAELRRYPNNYEAKLRLLVLARNKAATEAEKEEIQQTLLSVIAAKFAEAPTDMGNINKVTMGYHIVGQQERVDSLRQAIATEYPYSNYGIELRAAAISKAAKNDKKLHLEQLTTLLKDINRAAPEIIPAHLYRDLFVLYADQKDAANALRYLRLIPPDTTDPYYPLQLQEYAETLMNNDIALDTARMLLEKTLKMEVPAGVIRYFPETGYIIPYATDSAQQAMQHEVKAYCYSLLGWIDHKQGNAMAANAYMQKAVATSDDKKTRDNVLKYYSTIGDQQAYNALKEKEEAILLARIQQMKVNRPGPELTAITDLQGKPINPHQFKNKIILIDFWATWCVPCMEEMPYVEKLYQQYKNNPDVAFMIVNSGARNTLQDAQNWKGNKQYNFPVYYNTDPAVGEKFGFKLIPATYLIDKNGNIRYENIGFEGAEVELKLKLQLEDLLSE